MCTNKRVNSKTPNSKKAITPVACEPSQRVERRPSYPEQSHVKPLKFLGNSKANQILRHIFQARQSAPIASKCLGFISYLNYRKRWLSVKKYTMTKRELSCLIGNLFAELEPPCIIPDMDVITITGTTVSGSAAVLKIDGDTIYFEGKDSDYKAARYGRCVNCRGYCNKGVIPNIEG
jgi:hypothetical protein